MNRSICNFIINKLVTSNIYDYKSRTYNIIYLALLTYLPILFSNCSHYQILTWVDKSTNTIYTKPVVISEKDKIPCTNFNTKNEAIIRLWNTIKIPNIAEIKDFNTDLLKCININYQTHKLLFIELKKCGIEVKYVILDFEAGFTNWHFENFCKSQNISRDSLINFIIKINANLGYNRVELTNIFGINKNSNDYLEYNSKMIEIINSYINKSVYKALVEEYPNASLSNYNSYYVIKDQNVPDLNGNREELYPVNNIIGNIQTREFYGRLGNIIYKKELLKDYNLINNDISAFIYEIMKLNFTIKSGYQFNAWIAPKSWNKSQLYNSDYYNELIYHLILNNIQLLYWNYYSNQNDEYILAALVKNAINTIKKSHIDKSKYLFDPDLKDVFILSKNPSKNIYRFTALGNLKIISLNPFKCVINSKPISLPEFKVLNSSDKTSVGLWLTRVQ